MNNNIAATIQGKTFHYEGTLTIDFIDEIINANRITNTIHMDNSNYLFTTDLGHRELAEAATQFYNSYCEPGEQKELSTLSMLCGLHVVVLPTLPKNTLIIGTFVLREDDPIQPLPTEQAIEKIQWLSEQCNNNRPEGLD